MRWTRRPWQQGEISACSASLPAGINAQAYRERDSHVCGSCGCDMGSRFRSRAGFLDQCLVSSSTMASVGSGS